MKIHLIVQFTSQKTPAFDIFLVTEDPKPKIFVDLKLVYIKQCTGCVHCLDEQTTFVENRRRN